MNRLFNTLRSYTEQPRSDSEAETESEAQRAFDNRIEVLCKYAERASAYEEELQHTYETILDNLMQLQELMGLKLDEGRDRDALEYLRLAARLRPQRALLEQELRAFHAVAADLFPRVNTILDHFEAARALAADPSQNPAASYYLEASLTRLMRYFVLLERVAIGRHRALPQRLAEQMLVVVDDRQLDLELATFILSRRQALGPGRGAP